jgi:hypothetical protein
MAIIAENNGAGNFERELIPSGLQVARCYSMLEIGTVSETWEGQSKNQKKVRLTFELPNELRVFKPENGEQPMSISKTFTQTMHEKGGLRKFLEQWRGKAFTEDEAKRFDVSKLLGAPCTLTIVHTEKDGKTFSNISSIAPVMKNMSCPDQINPNKILSYDAFDWDIYNSLPEFLQNQMAATPEYGRLQAAMAAQNRNVATAQPMKPQELPTAEDDYSDLPF